MLKKIPLSQNWATVIAVVSAAVTLPFGESVIGVQLDAIAKDFAVHGALLQWVVNAYMLAFATSILVAGVLSDYIGRRRLFTLGLLFGLLGNGLAIISQSALQLVILRAVAGLSSGFIVATGPALLANQFPQPGKARNRAFAAFGAAAGSGIAFGPLVGGLIMSFASWRAVFIVYLPFLLLCLLLVPRLAVNREYNRQPVDGWGLFLFALILAGLIVLVEGSATSAWLWRLGAAVALLSIIFVWVERRKNPPALDLSFFANSVFSAMALLLVCRQVAVAVTMVFFPAVVIAGLGGSVKLAGAAILPMAVALFLAVPLGPWLVAYVKTRGFILVTGLFMAAGQAIIALTLGLELLPLTGGVVIGLLLIGIGGGAFNGCADNLALSTVKAGRSGAGSGVFQTVRMGSAAIAVAIAGGAIHISNPAMVGSGTNPAVAHGYALFAGVGAIFIVAVISFAAVISRRQN